MKEFFYILTCTFICIISGFTMLSMVEALVEFKKILTNKFLMSANLIIFIISLVALIKNMWVHL